MRKIKAQKSKRVNENTLIATVDIGKEMNVGYWRCPDGTEIEPFEFRNDGRGFTRFWKCIMKAKDANNLEEIIVGFESTGSYAEALAHFLRKRKVRLVQVNPTHSKKFREVQDNSPNKTDKKDPKVIANIVELGFALTVVIPEGAHAELRRLTHARERNMRRRTTLVNQLESMMAIIFPEFLHVMKDLKTVSARYLLKHYPTPQDIINLGLPVLTSTLKRTSRGQLTKERARALYEAAQTSVGVREGLGSILLEMQEILVLIEASERFTERLAQEMARFLQQIPYSRSILSIKGIKEITAAGIIGEVGDFTKFRTISEILKLAGLNLYEVSSGKHKGQLRITKRGRSLLRKFLYFAALNTIRKGGVMHETYQRYISRGMLKLKALIAVARKLLGIIFALVRDNSLYQEDYSRNRCPLKEAA